jgi:hypothetical protein
MNTRISACIAAAALSTFLGSCSVFEIDKPLFSDKDNRYQFFPMIHDRNYGNPILKTDKVKTEKAAIEIARRSCGSEADDAGHWYANQSGDVWIARWNVGQNSIYAKVRKSDGTFADCEVNDPAH